MAAVEGLSKEIGIEENGGSGLQDMAVDPVSEGLSSYEKPGGDVREPQGVGEGRLKEVGVDKDGGSGWQDMDNPESEELTEFFQSSSRSGGDEGTETRGTPSESRSREPKAEDLDENQTMEGDKGAETKPEEQEYKAINLTRKAPFQLIAEGRHSNSSKHTSQKSLRNRKHPPTSLLSAQKKRKEKSLGKRKHPPTSQVNSRKKRREDDSLVNQPSQGSSFHDPINDAPLVSESIQQVLSQFVSLAWPLLPPIVVLSDSDDSAAPTRTVMATETAMTEAVLLPLLIHQSAAKDNLESLKFCLKPADNNKEEPRMIPGGIVNCLESCSGRSPLHVACLHGNLRCVELLLGAFLRSWQPTFFENMVESRMGVRRQWCRR